MSLALGLHTAICLVALTLMVCMRPLMRDFDLLAVNTAGLLTGIAGLGVNAFIIYRSLVP